MDDKLKQEQDDAEATRRREMYRKLRKDIKNDERDEQEAKYQKRVDDINKKDKKKDGPINMDDGDDFLSGI